MAAIALQSEEVDVESSIVPFTLKRKMQIVSFAPFLEFSFVDRFLGYGHLFVNLGPALSLTSYSFRERGLRDAKETKTKISSQGKGLDFTLGLIEFRSAKNHRKYIALNYVSIYPGTQSYINIKNSREIDDVGKRRENDLDRVQVFSLSCGLYIL